MKTASSDEELAFKQKERDVAMYTRKARFVANGLVFFRKIQHHMDMKISYVIFGLRRE